MVEVLLSGSCRDLVTRPAALRAVCTALLLLALSDSSPAQQPAKPSAAASPVRVMEAGGLAAETAALIMTGQQGGSLAFEALTLPLSVAGRVPLLLEIDGNDLVADQQGEVAHLEVYAYCLRSDGRIADTLLKVVEIDLDGDDRRIERGGVRLYGDLLLTEGDYSLRILVRNLATSSLGLRVMPLAVIGDGTASEGGTAGSGPADRGLSISSPQRSRPRPPTRMLVTPLLGQPEDAWISAALGRDGEEPKVWERLGAGLPAARPVIVAGRTVGFVVLASDLRPEEKLTLDVTLFDGTEVARFPVEMGARRPGAMPSWESLDATFDADDLAPGDYLIRLLLGDGTEVWSGQIPVHVLARPFERDVVWAELTGDTTGLTEVGGDEAEEQAGATLATSAKEVRDGLLNALRLYAGGRTQASLRSLAEAEGAALAGTGAGLDRLRRIELRTAVELAGRDPELLVPVLHLFHAMYGADYARSRVLLSTHARRMIVALADRYVELGRSANTRSIAASYLAELAARLLAAGMPTLSDDMFLRALRLDSSNRTALLCLASGLGRRGLYGEAIPRLRRLVDSDPEHWEGWLRLAVNLEREGRFAEGEAIFRRLLDAADEDWIATLAYQELAGAYLRRDRTAEAEAVLQRGIEGYPEDQKLHLLLAFLHDSRRESVAASRQLESLGPTSDRPHSARYRYSQPPTEALDAARQELDQLAQDKLADLALALSSSPGAGG